MAKITGLNRLAVEGIKAGQKKYVLLGEINDGGGDFAGWKAFNASNSVSGGAGTVEGNGQTFLPNCFSFTEADGNVKITLGFTFENTDETGNILLDNLCVYELSSGDTINSAIADLNSNPIFSSNLVKVIFPVKPNVLGDQIIPGQVININMPTISLVD